MKALSIRQPWAWLVAMGLKDIENRSWPTDYRGLILIHAARTVEHEEYVRCLHFCIRKFNLALPQEHTLQRGGIIGQARLTGCLRDSDSPWFAGPFGFRLRDAWPRLFHPCRGEPGIFDVEMAFANPMSQS